jgi:hypothetical protein
MRLPLFLVLVTGCATTDSNRPYAAPSGSEEVGVSLEATAQTTGAPAADESAGAPAPPRAAVSPRASAPRPAQPPRERPGLATSWGESRPSHVREVSFERADEDAPFAVATLFYNDRAGVDAMAAHDLQSASLDAAVPIAGGLWVSLVDESGAPLPALSGGGRVYVLGEAGRRYSLLIANRTDLRYEAVISVDGLDVLDGKPAAVGKRGYLIGPHGTITVEGFRRSLEQVAAFRFGSVGASYAARTVGDRNVGVIGFAFFGERGATPWTETEIDRRHQATPFPEGRFATAPTY